MCYHVLRATLTELPRLDNITNILKLILEVCLWKLSLARLTLFEAVNSPTTVPMATNFCDLPTEIWLLIAHYLGQSQLSKLKSVNSFFLNCWMDLEWNHVDVSITTTYSATTVWALGRVVDPFVSVRVKHMSISLDLEKYGSASSSNTSFSTTLKALHLLPNITSLYIEVIECSTFHVFFRTIISSGVARKLQKLELSGHAIAYASLGESAHNAPFENLTELILIPSDNTQIDSSLILEPLLRSVASNLQILHIHAHLSELDLSPLFDALLRPLSQYDTRRVLFPNLKVLYVSFNNNFRSFPQSLHCFLLAHSNLRHLYLDPGRDDDEKDDEGLGDLADLPNNDFQYPSLRSLTIDPFASQVRLSALIRHSACILSSLKLHGHSLTFEEAKQVVDALTASQVQGQVTDQVPNKLKSLSMNIAQLSVSFLDLLAHKFPQLESLSLRVGAIIGSDQVCFPHSFISTRLKYKSYSIRFTISSATDGTTPTSHVPKETYCTPGNCTSSRFGKSGQTKTVTWCARWRMLYRRYLVRWRMTIMTA